MSKRIVVPEGMLKVALDSWSVSGRVQLHPNTIASIGASLEAALLWLSENPIVPTEEQWKAMNNERQWPDSVGRRQWLVAEWQRRMFLAPEPEVPEEIADLLVGVHPDVAPIALEAYRRGQRSTSRPMCSYIKDDPNTGETYRCSLPEHGPNVLHIPGERV